MHPIREQLHFNRECRSLINAARWQGVFFGAYSTAVVLTLLHVFMRMNGVAP